MERRSARAGLWTGSCAPRAQVFTRRNSIASRPAPGNDEIWRLMGLMRLGDKGTEEAAMSRSSEERREHGDRVIGLSDPAPAFGAA
ncbi:hypothetical protein PRIPAC_86405 [Pristionchus pacificus]|uniref:Uncharacterized protein n=1 Tax=Pristionchus pacificus TaxID=54126 RepID=A0A2A6CC61_PRIPA|nr:hypothetical protein PRIPAC_86405 [Pristionchus pacificus]|eukprot:PDM75729.1 hypothetical protein PRIPAC_40108 [Pristionchus pacificus]